MSNEKTGRRGKKRIWGKDDTELSLLALPTTIWYLLFCFLPMFGIIIAFKNYKVYGGFLTSFIKSEWVGFNNFKFLFSSKDIWLILRNTLGYNVIFIILGIVAPVAAAIAVGQLHSKKLAKAYQTAMFMPYFLSWVVVSALVWAFLSYDKGLINAGVLGNGTSAVVYEACYVASVPGIYEPVEGSWLRNGRLSGNHHRY